MAEPVPPINPLGENTPPPPPANEVYSGPGAMPDLTVSESPFPAGTNTPPPNPTDPPVMVREETNFAAPASGAGVTTATILPTSSGEPEMISYPSSGSRRNLMLPIIIGVLVLLIIVTGGFLFFSQNQGTTDNTDTITEAPTAEPTQEAIPTPQVLATIAYDNTEFNFTLDYPQGWEVKEGLNGNTAAFSDPSTSATATPSRVTVRVEATTSDLGTYAQQLQKIYSQLYTGWINITSAQTTLGSTPTIQAENTYTKGVNTVNVLQLILVQGGKAYTISGEAESIAFEDLRPTFIQILASLRFKS